jgi:hypothetical protein
MWIVSPSWVVATVDAHDDVDALTVDLGVAVEVAVGAELLDDVDRDGQTFAGRVDDDVFGADSDGDALAGGLADGVAVDRGDSRAELDAAVDDVGGQQVHGGRADEAGDEDVLRLLGQGRGVPTCCRTPSFRTAMRSPMVRASVWSCVT